MTQPITLKSDKSQGGYGDWLAKIVLLPCGVDPMTKTPPERTDDDETNEDGDEEGDRPDRGRMIDEAFRFAARCG